MARLLMSTSGLSSFSTARPSTAESTEMTCAPHCPRASATTSLTLGRRSTKSTRIPSSRGVPFHRLIGVSPVRSWSSDLDHGNVLRGKPPGYLGPVMRLPSFPCLHRCGGYDDVGDPVAEDGFHHPGEIGLGSLQVSQQLAGRDHVSSMADRGGTGSRILRPGANRMPTQWMGHEAAGTTRYGRSGLQRC